MFLLTLRRMICAARLVGILLVYLAVPGNAENQFRPPELVSATDTRYPIQSVANGIVVLDVLLDKQGAIAGLHTVRDIPSLTSIATSSIQKWRFKPASRDGAPQNSMMRVAFAFRPRGYYVAPPHFGSVPSGDLFASREVPGYSPPGIVSVAYPRYPINTANVGSVVVQIALGTAGEVQHVRIIRALDPFTAVAVNAAKKWQFEASASDGRPITSNIVVVFVFAPLPPNR
jgi:TonB family protein